MTVGAGKADNARGEVAIRIIPFVILDQTNTGSYFIFLLEGDDFILYVAFDLALDDHIVRFLLSFLQDLIFIHLENLRQSIRDFLSSIVVLEVG